MSDADTKPVTAEANGYLLSTSHLVKAYNQRRVVERRFRGRGCGRNRRPARPERRRQDHDASTWSSASSNPMKASVHFEKHNITRLPMHKRARLGIGYLTQEPSVFRKLTVEQNILAILETCNMSCAGTRGAPEIFAR